MLIRELVLDALCLRYRSASRVEPTMTLRELQEATGVRPEALVEALEGLVGLDPDNASVRFADNDPDKITLGPAGIRRCQDREGGGRPRTPDFSGAVVLFLTGLCLVGSAGCQRDGDLGDRVRQRSAHPDVPGRTEPCPEGNLNGAGYPCEPPTAHSISKKEP